MQCDLFSKYEFRDVQRFVIVNKFDDESYKAFIADCEKVINSGQEFLPIVIDSYGGYVYSLLGMVDFLQSCEIDVLTVCEAKSMSCGAVLFSCGKERYIGPSATIMIHDISSFLWGKEVELQNDVKECTRVNKKVFGILDRNTRQKPGYWQQLVKSNKFANLYLTATKAKQHNLATGIGLPHIETVVSANIELIIRN